MIGVVGLVSGCTASSPYLIPEDVVGSESRSAIQVMVTPVVTSGIGSEQRARYGVDLSAYFTAFEVRVVNRSKSRLTFDPRAFTMSLTGAVWHPFDEEESLAYYRRGTLQDGKSIVLVEKPYATIRKEMDRIVSLRLKPGSVEPEQSAQGLIYFKKVSPEACGKITLDIRGVTVVSTGEGKNFRFSFSCPKEG